ncbi:sulfite exporter TauE/SafE family protein [Paramagnetospirillum marisnigri]|nr:sulfite exporter TauE/SafE family protein [Paramagnetospirillum marisnigri]
MSDLGGLLHAGLDVCRVGIDGREGLIGGLFLTGLVGSLTHCSGMCGPFVLAQVAARLEAIPLSRLSEARRLAGAALVPYHLGRGATYGLLGAAAAGFSGILGGGTSFRMLGAGLLSLAALLLLALTIPAFKGLAGGGESAWGARVGRLAAPLFSTPFGLRGFALGVMLGFIPCGLLYAALAAAAAGGNPVAGGFGMLAFWAGTVPMLVAVAAVGHAAVGRWRSVMAHLAPGLLIVNAGVLGFMAWQLVNAP